ncbi:BLOC-3 complex member HPS4 isoform X2 [Paroedura picta]|uniref:BLOC-3 complex member HPS4 isoform X2 n=1 Tax=Paroedura picta TaxID=143630 RepID=UPI0040572FA5
MAAWWPCFFLYDGARVKAEGDPTRAGICCFCPRQTPLGRQELLCSQVAGVVRWTAEISGSPPQLIRLRKLKFAVRVDGSHLWEQPWEELDQEWEKYMRHLQHHTNNLHRIFRSLWAMDKTKVDPLLLLKAALILQTCQRAHHILAGCIIYKGLVVSTQLPPSLTAKVLLQEAEASPQGQAADAGQLQDPESIPLPLEASCLPRGVQIISVYLLENEAAALRDFPLEWMAKHPEGSVATPTAIPSGPDGATLERGVLYVHRVRDLVLALLAEEQFAVSKDSIEDVYHSSLASLNGLEVHLKETIPKDSPSSVKSSYGFAHYDSIQNLLSTNFLPAAGNPDQHFLRAVSLIHADFEQLPLASEMTVRNASTAVYACRNSVQETYFQQLGSLLRHSGAPNPRDSAFALPSKAKQKLLKHGVNLL